MDESATGLVNFFGPACILPVVASIASAVMHLRMPSIDQGVQAFIWTLVFFLFMWLGALAVGFSGPTSFVVSLLLACGIFLLVRTRGGDYPRPR